MKLLLSTLLAIPLVLPAQVRRDWGAFNHRVDVTGWQGHRFKLTAAVRSVCIDSFADAEIWTRIDKDDAGRKMGFFYNMMDKPIRDSQWKVYTILGKVDKDGKWLNFGGLYHHRGYFYFDDFHLWMETPGTQWEEIPIGDGDFEGDTAAYHKNWFFYRNAHFFTPLLSTENPFQGAQVVKVDGSQPFDGQYYGTNDTAGHFIRANGIKLYYETYGQGQPLLLLHGDTSSIVTFDRQIPEFSKHYRVIAVDSRGQGRSGEDGRTYTYDLFAEDMNALLDSLHLDSVNVLGWSDGGNTGLIMAMKYPRMVRRLAVMGANIFIDKTVVYPWVYRLLKKDQEEADSDSTAWGANRRRLLTLLYTEPRHNFDELRSIGCPVLVMAGEKDVIREGHTRQIAAHIPQGRVLIFPKGTHEEPSGHPDVFNKAVEDFLSTP